MMLLCQLNISFAGCEVFLSNDHPSPPQSDPLYQALIGASSCPSNVQEFRALLKNNGSTLEPTMVANRGFHNPDNGSFSYFEMVKDQDLFFGHFTGLSHHKLVLDQNTSPDYLMIQSIVWDPQKEMYNFYELRGKGGSSRWYYRGDSLDALMDNQYLYREVPEGMAQFGERMRCSACHNAGTPIMKELTPPYNDWWLSSRHLPFGSYQKSAEVNAINRQLVDASVLSQSVKMGMKKLFQSPAYLNKLRSLSLQEQLRPLFCTTEINLAADLGEMNMKFEIPSGFWLDPRLGEVNSKISIVTYEMLLRKSKSKFPETTRKDAEHAWLTPVRSKVDQLAVDRLLQDKVVDEDFVKAVLGVDFTHPVFSTPRCELLKLVPEQHDPDWMDEFKENLEESHLSSSNALLKNMEDAEFGFPVLDASIRKYQSMPKSPDLAFKKLLEVRSKISDSEMSKNPQGQILEPGFRIVFPVNSSQNN